LVHGGDTAANQLKTDAVRAAFYAVFGDVMDSEVIIAALARQRMISVI
jgi:hypothetical protein